MKNDNLIYKDTVTLSLSPAEARSLHFVLGACLPFLADDAMRGLALRVQNELVAGIGRVEGGVAVVVPAQ